MAEKEKMSGTTEVTGAGLDSRLELSPRWSFEQENFIRGENMLENNREDQITKFLASGAGFLS